MASAVLGNELPGPGSIYLGQTLKFLAPVHIGDKITVSVEVITVREQKRILTLRTECTNQQGDLVLSGEAIVKYISMKKDITAKASIAGSGLGLGLLAFTTVGREGLETAIFMLALYRILTSRRKAFGQN